MCDVSPLVTFVHFVLISRFGRHSSCFFLSHLWFGDDVHSTLVAVASGNVWIYATASVRVVDAN